MKKGLYLLAAGMALSPFGSALAQMDMSGQTASMQTMEMRDEIAPGDLPVPQKMTGIGNAHMQITATPEAQMWFDQGLNLLHDYWDYESARAFEQGVRVDPQCAMCYWGLYKAESFYHSTSQGYAGKALDQAIALKDHVSEREQLYIEASAAAEGVRQSGAAASFSNQELPLLRKLVKKFPKDTQARIFLANAVGGKEARSIYESILKDNPDDSAANHYYIHKLEADTHPEQALHSAEILASLAPASGHMVHMPGHIFFRIGDYARAEQSFAASTKVDEQYMRDQHVQPDNDWNYVHNLMYAIANLMEEGKMSNATALSMKLTGARGNLESTLYIYSTRDSISRLNPRLPVALRTANWQQVNELLNTTTPSAGHPNLDFLARQLATFAAAMQALEAHDLAKAEELSTKFDAELKDKQGMPGMTAKTPPADPPKIEVNPDALLRPLLSSLAIMSLELKASLLTAQGKATDAKTLFDQAAKAEKALGYHEPPGYIRPVAETEAAAMMAIGDWTDATAAYERALIDRPRSGFALYGIALSKEKSGDAAAAAKAYADFLTAWKDADPAELQQRTPANLHR